MSKMKNQIQIHNLINLHNLWIIINLLIIKINMNLKMTSPNCSLSKWLISNNKIKVKGILLLQIKHQIKIGNIHLQIK